jgi:hypothetical protein
VPDLAADGQPANPAQDPAPARQEWPARPIQQPAPPVDFSGWILPALVGFGVLAVVIAALARVLAQPAVRARVRIVAVPPGEAPQHIRRAWVGLELPVTQGQPGQGVVGVLSQRPGGSCDGYAVDGVEAVRLLAAEKPDAAAWWRHHAPHVLTSGYQLVFPADVCQRLL